MCSLTLKKLVITLAKTRDVLQAYKHPQAKCGLMERFHAILYELCKNKCLTSFLLFKRDLLLYWLLIIFISFLSTTYIEL